MAMIKIELKNDSTKVRFDSLKVGEVFGSQGKTYIKVSANECVNAVDISTGERVSFIDYHICTYVKEATLSLII